MRIALIVSLAALIVASTPAHADPLDSLVQPASIQPALAFRADFGGPKRADYRFGLTLTDRDATTLAPPPMLTLYENGQQKEKHSNWGWNVGWMLLAGGAAVALIVVAAGHAAEEQQQKDSQHGPGGDGGGTNDDQHGNCVGVSGSGTSTHVDNSGCPVVGGG